MPTSVILPSKSFKSIAECKRYTRSLLIKVNICESVKEKDLEVYKFLLELCQRHPNANEKLKNHNDFKIHHDALNKKAFAFDIINTNGTIIDISWIICCEGKGKSIKYKFNSALRQCISTQILDFKLKSDLYYCTICNNKIDNNLNIDHEIHFEQLKNDFMAKNKIEMPTDYDEEPITYLNVFKPNDKWIGVLFYDYHLINAKLRVTCQNCNLTRSKYIKK